MNKYKHFLKFLIAPFISFIILALIFGVEELYPFGNYSIVQSDADYQFIPVLYRIYDFLHGNAGIIYDDIGFGNNIFISMVLQGSIFSPINLLLYFTTRSNVINFFNILVIAKICLLSLTTYIFINYKFKLEEFYKVLFSILYSLSGWIMLNYFNIMWLDVVILFPLIVMFLDILMSEGKYVGYVITLGLSLTISYYISFFVIIFILFYSLFYLTLFENKKNTKKIILRLGICTFIAVLLSSFSVLPSLYQTFISSRIEYVSVAKIFDFFLNKCLYLMGSSLFFILFGKLLIKFKIEKKSIILLSLLLFLFIIGLFIEPINLAIHMGSHWAFPYRYSFITIFILMISGLFYINKFKLNGKNNWYWLIIFSLFLGIGIYFNSQYVDKIIDNHIVIYFFDQEIFNYILMIFIISLILNYIAINFKNRYLRYFTISCSSLFIIFAYASWTMFYNEAYFLTNNSVKINENIELPKNGRYKMNYNLYTPNYGFVYDVDTLDNWLHILPKEVIDSYHSLGYKVIDTNVSSYGGTVFSDWLFNFKYIISQDLLNDDIYTYIDDYDSNYYLYKYNYNSGFGVEYSNLENINIEGSPFSTQNNISNSVLGKKIINVSHYNIENVDNYNLSFKLDKKGFLYFYSSEVSNLINFIKINNKIVYNFGDYIKYLGIYDNDLEISISFKDFVFADLEFGFISYDDIISLENNNVYSDHIEINSNGKNLFIPINNIPGLKIYNNSKEVNIDSFLENFVSIKLENGNNKIEFKYEMPYFYVGIVLSVIGLFLFIIYRYIPSINLLENISYYLFYFVGAFLVFYFYIYSFIKYKV